MSKDDKKKDKSDKKEKKALERIQETLEQIHAQQQEICRRIERLESRAPTDAISDEKLFAFLDEFRAAEALGEASLGAWIEVSDQACVRGALRTIAQREGMHARLLEARMKELGATPRFEIPAAVHERVMEAAADPDVPDAKKVADFVARFPDVDAAVQPILDVADRLEHDQETQSLLRTIAQDERSTLEFLQDACRQLSG